MTFSVNIQALTGLPDSLDRRKDDLRTAVQYLWANTDLDYGTGLADIAHRHQHVITNVSNYLQDVAFNDAGIDAVRLRQAITAYAHADLRAARRSDAALPPPSGLAVPQPPLTTAERALGPGVFADISQPVAALITPVDHHGDFPYQPGWFDLLSPGSILRDVIWYVSGAAADFGLLDRAYDPFEYLVGPYVGDWAGLLRCAEVFEHIADLLIADGSSVAQVNQLVPDVWTGNAADLCMANLREFTGRLEGGAPQLRAIAASYRAVAQGVHDNAELLAVVLTDLFDWGVEAAAEIGTLGLFSAYEASSMVGNFVKTLRAALRIAGAVQDIVAAGFSMSDDVAHRLGLLTRIPVMPSLGPAVPAIAAGPPAPLSRAIPRPVGRPIAHV